MMDGEGAVGMSVGVQGRIWWEIVLALPICL
jgi:hypothetical protein